MSNTIIIMHAHMESVNLFKRETFCQQANKNAPACMYCSLQLASFPFLNSGTTRIVSSARPIFSNCTQKNNKNKKRAGSNFLNSFFFIQRLLYFKCEAEAASTLSKGCRRRRKSGFTYQSYILLFCTLFENYQKCLISLILAFSTHFCPIKIYLSDNTVSTVIFSFGSFNEVLLLKS